MKIPGGYIVAIEGIDAAGKNTQSLLLSRWLRRKGIEAARMSFPDYDTPIGKEIRSFLSGRRRAYPIELQHLLFAANRWKKLEDIKSRLRAGEAVIVNRYTESNLAYGRANGLDSAWLAGLEDGLPKANLVIVLDASPRALRSRRPSSSRDLYEKSSALQGKAQKAYRELGHERRWSLVDADRPIGDIQASVVKIVREALLKDRGTST
jgi:dTMP kinase